MAIVDQFGREFRKQDLDGEVAGPTAFGLRSVWRESQVKGLTPTKLARLLRAADASNYNDEYLVLAEEMEEKDLHYASVLSTRKLAVSRLVPRVNAVSDDDQAVEEAEFANAIVKTRAFRSMLFDAMDGIGKGYAMIEIAWDTSRDRWRPKSYAHRDPRWFRFDSVDMVTPRLLEGNNYDGVDLPPFRFIYHRPKLKSGIPIRGGFARLAAFAYMCKSYSVKDWLAFAEVYGMPLRLGRFDNGASEADIAALKTAVFQLGHDAGAVLPKGMDIEFIDSLRMTGSGSTPVFAGLAAFLNAEMSKGILGQTASTEGTAGRLGADDEQGRVRDDIRDHDADDLAATLQRDVINPAIAMNWGDRPEDEYPQLELMRDEPEDLKATSDALVPYIKAGLRVEAQQIRDKFNLDEPAEGAEVIGESNAPSEPQQFVGAPIPPPPPAPAAAAERKPPDAIEEVEVLTDEETVRWREQMDPILDPVIRATLRARDPQDLEVRLAEAQAQADQTILTQRLATQNFKARGFGDAQDSPLAVSPLATAEVVYLLRASGRVASFVFDAEQFDTRRAVAWAQQNGWNGDHWAYGKDRIVVVEFDKNHGTGSDGDRGPGFITVQVAPGISAIVAGDSDG